MLWNKEVNEAVTMKKKFWKAWEKGGYIEFRTENNCEMSCSHVKESAEDAKFENMEGMSTEIFCIAKRMKHENTDFTGETSVTL